MVIKCIVRNCENSYLSAKMHSFPKDPARFRIWIDAIGRSDLTMDTSKNCRMCDQHFSCCQKFLTDRNRTNLKANAVPDVNLPASEDLYEKNPDPNIFEPVPGTSKDSQYETLASGSDDQGLTIPVDRPATPKMSAEKRKRLLPSPVTPKFTKKDIRSRMSLLHMGTVERQKVLTPKARRFYKVAKGMLRTARRLLHEKERTEELLEEVKRAAQNEELLRGKVNKTTLQFINSQLQLQSKKSRGRRFTLDNKIFCLSLLKQSPRCYRLLQKTFALPSRKTLMTLLNKVPFACGINAHIMSCLEKTVADMKGLDKYCCLLFDEMSLEASLIYNEKADCIIGFEDTGVERRPKFADHTMVFMARGIAKKWKQPIAYYFYEGGIKSTELQIKIVEIIRELHRIGLKVVATVCDQLSVNTTAINKLKERTEAECRRDNRQNRMFGFAVDGAEVVPLYDPPHLLKGMRNNLLDGKAKFTWNQQRQQVASWDDVARLYELDVGDHDTRMLNKLTDVHIYTNKIKKMKVKYAAQVFSQRVSSVMRALARHGVLPGSASDTADLLLFMNKVFDSVNGNAVTAAEGSPLRCAVQPNSHHVTLWYEAIKVFSTIQFFSSRKHDYVPPTVKNWILTLRGFVYIWRELQKVGFNFLCTRNLNQDPLENFFGCIRSHGVRNINPNCSAFTASFKTLIVNNFVSPHSPGANCEIDESEGIINCLQNFFTDEHPEESPANEPDVLPDPNFNFLKRTAFIVEGIHGYIAGFLARKILRQIGVCPICRRELIGSESIPEHFLIEARAYGPKALLRPNTVFVRIFGKCSDVLHHYLPKMCTQGRIGQAMMDLLYFHISFEYLTCTQHNVSFLFVKHFVHMYIVTWIKNVNGILRGITIKNVNDDIKKKAHVKYVKVRSWKDKIRQLKGLQ